MNKDWDAEQAEIERELANARKALDSTFREAVPGVNRPANTTPADLKAYGEARKAFEAIKDRRITFLSERARHEARS